MNAVVLKQGRDKAVRNRHHWIFSGAVHRFPEFEDGDILAVQSGSGELLGHAYFNRKSSIVGRMISFGDEPPGTAIRASFARALALRDRFFDPAATNAVRLVNAEGDCLPGLVVDRYDDVLVVQVATLGMEKLKPLVLELLTEALHPRAILERSDLPARRDEGLEDRSGVLAGAAVEKVRILENGVSYWVDLVRGQKTGFFLDQRESRKLVRDVAAGRRVLNTFAYSGSFSVCAVLGGALRADSVDTSETAMALAEENFELNGIPADKGVFFRGDVFEFRFRQEADRRRRRLPRLQGHQPAGLSAGPYARPGPDLLLFAFRRGKPLPAGRLPGCPGGRPAGPHPAKTPPGLRPSGQRLSPRDSLPQGIPALRRLSPASIPPFPSIWPHNLI
jgi:23S rRNA (cytosine1962-C5)-methyltransferase